MGISVQPMRRPEATQATNSNVHGSYATKGRASRRPETPEKKQVPACPRGKEPSTKLDPAQRPLVPHFHPLPRLSITFRSGFRFCDALFAEFD